MTTLPGAPPVAGGIPFGTRIGQVAREKPDEVALVFAAEDGGERTLTWDELDLGSTRLAHVLAGRGLGLGNILAVCLRNSPEHLISSFAAWKLGATVVPVRWDLPAWERERVLATLAPRLLVDADHLDLFEESRSAPADPLPEVVSPHGWGVCSSGSTGTPKVILVKNPGLFVPGFGGVSSVVEAYGKLPMPQRVLVPAPLYHTNGFTATRNLMAGVPVVLLERFNAPRILDLVERHRVTGFIGATPMLQRIAQVPGIEARDLSSLDWVQQGASPLPVWLGRQWCELVGPERFYMSYGASEMHGLVTCRGDEWLEHPGTLGRGLRRDGDPDPRPRRQGAARGRGGDDLHADPHRPGGLLRGRRRGPHAGHGRRLRHRGGPGMAGGRWVPLPGRPPRGHDRDRGRPTSSRPRWSPP